LNIGRGPLFQSLGQQGVIRVAKGVPGDVPRCVPIQQVLVHQSLISSATAMGRMGVIELDGVPLVKCVQGVAGEEMKADQVLKEQETKKYCCASRRTLPMAGSSLG